MNREKRSKRDKFDLLEAVHKSEYESIKRPVGKKTNAPIEPAHKFEVNLEPDKYTNEKYAFDHIFEQRPNYCRHQLLIKYQKEVHKDPEWRWRKESFTRFLCSGLNQQVLKIRGKTMKLGSYHQCYRLDGKLVAVGVLDLLPQAVSSVYLL